MLLEICSKTSEFTKKYMSFFNINFLVYLYYFYDIIPMVKGVEIYESRYNK